MRRLPCFNSIHRISGLRSIEVNHGRLYIELGGSWSLESINIGCNKIRINQR